MALAAASKEVPATTGPWLASKTCPQAGVLSRPG
jgi:hypothetical protein